MKFDPDGHLRLYDDDNSNSTDLLMDYVSECAYPTVCGNYSLCSNGKCSCLPGFVQDDVSEAQGNFRCKEISPTTCENPLSHSILPVKGIYYSNSKGGILKETNMEDCKRTCLNTCSCKVAVFQYDDSNVSHGDCLLPSPVFSLTDSPFVSLTYKGNEVYTSGQFQTVSSFALIKISNDSGSGGGSDVVLTPEEHRGGSDAVSTSEEHRRGSARRKIIAGITAVTFLLVGLTVGFSWIVVFEEEI